MENLNDFDSRTYLSTEYPNNPFVIKPILVCDQGIIGYDNRLYYAKINAKVGSIRFPLGLSIPINEFALPNPYPFLFRGFTPVMNSPHLIIGYEIIFERNIF